MEDPITIVSLLVGVIGTSIAIYQAAVIREGKKRKSELQYILAGINNAALQKQQTWQNQISTLKKLESEQDWEMGRLYLRAKDDFAEIASLTIALEGTIDIDNSAIKSMMDKSIEIVRKNNVLQEEGMKNPLFNNPVPEPEKKP
ncbi:hypothetical protein SAMN02745866_03199 [Alteromonadaceae bacterium Bs31]|nr:hypothetical protein SAMN02745866_03199 [Alteromonadaceae bacterium Bs31]